MLSQLKQELNSLSNPEKAKVLQRFFKTGPGQYGEGDIFLGITVPEVRKTAKSYIKIELKELKQLLSSKIHEERLAALEILVFKYESSENKQHFFEFFMKNIEFVNNWDLVDLTAPKIVGNFLLNRKRNLLFTLATSENLWERRIAIVATYEFIKNDEFQDTLKISEILLKDKHDLIHKAVGWMLRELGKKNQDSLEDFLKKHKKEMPRTMLRYAIEKFEEEKRKFYLRR
jgi:3-methyladenine DNA glycosylase AlkD